MTATIVERGTEIIEDFEYDEAVPCDRLDPDDLCDNAATYVIRTACCGFVLLLCESCLFEFIEFAREYSGQDFTCSHCNAAVVLNPNHLIVTARI